MTVRNYELTPKEKNNTLRLKLLEEIKKHHTEEVYNFYQQLNLNLIEIHLYYFGDIDLLKRVVVKDLKLNNYSHLEMHLNIIISISKDETIKEEVKYE